MRDHPPTTSSPGPSLHRRKVLRKRDRLVALPARQEPVFGSDIQLVHTRPYLLPSCDDRREPTRSWELKKRGFSKHRAPAPASARYSTALLHGSGRRSKFARSQAVASGDAFEHRPPECGHCVQNFLADLDLRDLPGEAARFELGADHALPTTDLRFYPAAPVVPCGHLPGHAAVAADQGNMAIPNGWIPRRLRSDHCVLRRRYNHIQGLPIPPPQHIPYRGSVTSRTSARKPATGASS